MNMALSFGLANRTEIRAHTFFEIAINALWCVSQIVRSTGGRQFANSAICIAFALRPSPAYASNANTELRSSKLVLLPTKFIDDITKQEPDQQRRLPLVS